MQFTSNAWVHALLAISRLIGVTGLSLRREASAISPDALGIKGDYQTATPTFVGNFNGEDIALQGHTTEVVAQLGLLYPGSTANLTSRGVVTSADDLEVIRKSALTPRNKNEILCTLVAGQSLALADPDGVTQGIDYMLWLSDNYFTVKIGPSKCLVMVCFRQTSIILCNDNHYAISPGLEYLASYARDIINTCRAGG